MPDQREDRRISRRTIAKGAAWAIPAVPVVVATPAYASSGGRVTGVYFASCKQPGKSCDNFTKAYAMLVKVSNPTGKDLYVYPTSNGTVNPKITVVATSSSNVTFTYSGARRLVPGNPPTLAVLPAAYKIVPGGTLDLVIDVDSNADSANFSVSGYLRLAWGHTTTPGADPEHPYTPVPSGSTGSPHGKGWVVIPFTIPSFKPCDSKTCLPATT